MVHYLKLQELDEATELLWVEGPACLVLAGGTDILSRPDPFAERTLVLDIHQIPELVGVAQTDGVLRVGAATTLQTLAEHPLVRRRARLLSIACGSIGSLQIRNRGTLGGNLGNASPAGDSIPALLCLGASVRVRSRGAERVVPLDALLRGPGETSLACHELIEAVELPPLRGRRVAFFRKVGQRRGMCCAKASVAFHGRIDGEGRLGDVRVALGAVAPTAIRVPRAQAILEGRKLGPRTIRDAAEACREAARAIDDIRSTAAYRRHVVGALLAEGLLDLAERARARRAGRQGRTAPSGRRRHR